MTNPPRFQLSKSTPDVADVRIDITYDFVDNSFGVHNKKLHYIYMGVSITIIKILLYCSISKMRLSLIVLKFVNLTEAEYEHLKSPEKKQKCLELIRRDLGVDRFNELHWHVDDLIEIYIGLSKGYRRLEINNRRKSLCF
jgi:hypothetical protein